jgi:hypothetical protein
MSIPAPNFWSSRVCTNCFIRETLTEGSVENSTYSDGSWIGEVEDVRA